MNARTGLRTTGLILFVTTLVVGAVACAPRTTGSTRAAGSDALAAVQDPALLAPLTYVEAEDEGEGGDMEPVDPAEQRVQTQPPPRPVARGGGVWTPLGPSPTQSAQVDVPPDDEVSGAVHAIAAHPTNADILYIGAANGGIWKTTNATAARPTWTPQTDDLTSQSIGAL
ncbi:MAG TPA: hypothetical protein VLF18_03575, partial [Tahibacter sp.]|uniref:hypothetical protein n=1 Tax=Tahibacter sp. TaxID=2056211 RepID=UPI002B8C95EE